MLAFTDTTVTKDQVLAQLRAHAEADEIVKGRYWQDGKGCAVGCTIHSDNHVEYERRFGIPQMLAQLEDCIFEGLPNGAAKAWPTRFMSAVPPGADLSLVGWQFLYWLLTDETINPGIGHLLVRDAVKECASVLLPLTKGGPINTIAARSAESAAWSAAESAAWSAWSAARSAWSAAESAARSAWSAAASAASAARSAARSAESAARSAESAESAARSAESAESAARSAWSAAESAAWSAWSAARSAWSAAESAAYIHMSDKLIELIEAA